MSNTSEGKLNLLAVKSDLFIWKDKTVNLRSDLYILNRVEGRFGCGLFTLDILTIGFQIYIVMASVGLRVEDRLDGGGSWIPWKTKIVILLEENELWEIVECNHLTHRSYSSL